MVRAGTAASYSPLGTAETVEQSRGVNAAAATHRAKAGSEDGATCSRASEVKSAACDTERRSRVRGELTRPAVEQSVAVVGSSAPPGVHSTHSATLRRAGRRCLFPSQGQNRRHRGEASERPRRRGTRVEGAHRALRGQAGVRRPIRSWGTQSAREDRVWLGSWRYNFRSLG